MNYFLQRLDQITMYRVVLYVLAAWIVISLALSVGGILFFTPLEIIAAVVVLVLSSVVAHYICKSLWKAPANLESTIITALILFFLFDPTKDLQALGMLALIGVMGVVGKYILAYRKLHIFNPVALAAFLAAMLGVGYANWWIGTLYLLPFVLLGGAIITTKIRRWPLVLATIVAGLLVNILVLLLTSSFELGSILTFFVSWPIIFFATVMVTEPLSTPAGTKNHILYGALVGALSSTPFVFGPLYSSPELALLVGNLIFWPLSLRGRLVMKFDSVKEIAHNTYEYVFKTNRTIHFKPGQYLEWTLPHTSPDSRGIARYFSLASAPNNNEVRLGLRIMPEGGSSFKQKLSEMEQGDVMYATSLDGDFTLPHDTSVPLVFIAGGIGITPFASMVRALADKQEQRSITLFYCNNHEEDIAYQDVFSESDSVRLVNVLSKAKEGWSGERGFVTKEMIEKYVTEYSQARYYISGPPGMVNAYKKLLGEMGISRKQIVTDYFPGLA